MLDVFSMSSREELSFAATPVPPSLQSPDATPFPRESYHNLRSVFLHSFLNSAVEGVRGQFHAPGTSLPGEENSVPTNRRLDGLNNEQENLPPLPWSRP